MANGLEALARRHLVRLQRHTPRPPVAGHALPGRAADSVAVIFCISPCRQYTLRIAGSEVVSNRHYQCILQKKCCRPACACIASASDA